MSDDGVPEDEMRPNPSHPDSLDSVLDGVHSADSDEDLLDMAAFVLDLRATYSRSQPLELGTELAAFTGAHLPEELSTAAGGAPAAGPDGDTKTGRKRPAMLTPVSGFLATVTGKVVLGAAVATASVGGLHAAEVVEVPVLPDSHPPTQPAGSTGASAPETPDGTGGGPEDAEGTRAEAGAYSEAMQTWTDCVAEVAPDRDPEAEGAENAGGPDLAGECGGRPSPADFGIPDPDLPDQAADTAEDATGGAPRGPGTAEETPAGERRGPTTEHADEAGSAGGQGRDTPPPGPADPPGSPADTPGEHSDQGTDSRTGGRP